VRRPADESAAQVLTVMQKLAQHHTEPAQGWTEGCQVALHQMSTAAVWSWTKGGQVALNQTGTAVCELELHQTSTAAVRI